jgi:hypothetical protein
MSNCIGGIYNMKRLIRKASLDIGQFIVQWINQPNIK